MSRALGVGDKGERGKAEEEMICYRIQVMRRHYTAMSHKRKR